MFLDVVVNTDESILQFHRMLSVLQRVLAHSLSPRERARVRGLFPRALDPLSLTLSQREREPNVYVSCTARRYRP
jgi:hypothetical protein